MIWVVHDTPIASVRAVPSGTHSAVALAWGPPALHYRSHPINVPSGNLGGWTPDGATGDWSTVSGSSGFFMSGGMPMGHCVMMNRFSGIKHGA